MARRAIAHTIASLLHVLGGRPESRRSVTEPLGLPDDEWTALSTPKFTDDIGKISRWANVLFPF